MGASLYWNDLTGDTQQAFLTMANGTSTSNYATITYDDGPDWVGLWNSSNGWLHSNVNAAYKDTLRIAAKHDSTIQRKLFVNGLLKGTGNTIGARPAGAGTNMDFVINAADTSGNDDGEAYYQFVWARDDYVSDAWMAADGLSNLTPASFHSITEL